MEENIRENKMGTMSIGRLLANMAAPMMVSMLFQALYNIVDSVFVARLSQDAMNAVSLAFPLQTLCIAFSVGTGVGMNALLSRSLGEKNQEAANRAAGTGLFLTLCTAAFFAVLGLTLALPFFRFQRNLTKVQQLYTNSFQRSSTVNMTMPVQSVSVTEDRTKSVHRTVSHMTSIQPKITRLQSVTEIQWNSRELRLTNLKSSWKEN